jgi:hypothetical protein
MRLTETIDFSGAEFIEQNGARVVKNVVMLGPVSSHGYEYSEQAMKEAVNGALYEGCRCFIDHATGNRSVMDLAGVFRNVRFQDGKVKGDAHLLDDEKGQKFWTIAQAAPGAASCSHVAEGKLVQRDGKRVVEQIVKVFSVDLVVHGATTRNVFESQADSTLPKPMQGEKQYQFIPRCINEVQAANATLTGEEAGAICFMAWQSRYESGGMAADQHIPVATPKNEIRDTTGSSAQKERESMSSVTENILNDIARQNEIKESASAFLDPNNEHVVRRHMAEADHQAFEQARQQEARDQRDKVRITEQLVRQGFSEPRNMMIESDYDFSRRLQENQRRRDPLAHLSLSEAAAVTAARSALTLTE